MPLSASQVGGRAPSGAPAINLTGGKCDKNEFGAGSELVLNVLNLR